MQDWRSSLMAAKGLASSEVHPLFLSVSEITCPDILCPSEISCALQSLCWTPKHCPELLRSLKSFRIIFFKTSCAIYEKYSSLNRIPLAKYKQSFFQVLELHPWHVNCGPNTRLDHTIQPLSPQIHEHACEIWDKLGKKTALQLSMNEQARHWKW